MMSQFFLCEKWAERYGEESVSLLSRGALPEPVVYLTLVMGPLLSLVCRRSLLQERLDGNAHE